MRPEPPDPGWCAPEIERELPGLRLPQTTVEPALGRSLTGRSTPAVLAALRDLSDRWRGARAVNVRQEAVTGAYRVLYRQIGLDPERLRTPLEALVVERMLDGGFLSRDMLSDVLSIALLDTGAPIWALDEDRLQGPLGLRLSRDGEAFGRSRNAAELTAGKLAIADSAGIAAIPFGPFAPELEPDRRTRRLRLFSVAPADVSDLHVEEAFWKCRSLLAIDG